MFSFIKNLFKKKEPLPIENFFEMSVSVRLRNEYPKYSHYSVEFYNPFCKQWWPLPDIRDEYEGSRWSLYKRGKKLSLMDTLTVCLDCTNKVERTLNDVRQRFKTIKDIHDHFTELNSRFLPIIIE